MLWNLTFKVNLLQKESLCVHQTTAFFVKTTYVVNFGCLDICQNKYSYLFIAFLCNNILTLVYMLHMLSTVVCTQAIQLQLHCRFCGMKPLKRWCCSPRCDANLRQTPHNDLSGCRDRLLVFVYTRKVNSLHSCGSVHRPWVGSRGDGTLWKAGEERPGKGIPKVSGTGRNREIF